MANKLSKRKYNNLLSGRNNYYDTGGDTKPVQGWVTPVNPMKALVPSGGIATAPSHTGALAIPTLPPVSGGGGGSGGGLGNLAGMMGGPLAIANAVAGPLGHLIGDGIAGGLSSGAGDGITKVTGALGGIPLVGGLVEGGGALLGGITNRLIGMKVNQAEVDRANQFTSLANNAATDAINADSFDSDALSAGPVAANFNVNAYEGGVFMGGKAKRKNAKLANQMRDAYAFADRASDNTIGNLQTQQLGTDLANFAAHGGPIGTHGGDFTNGLIYINNGGTHEANPNEGVMVGVDQQEVPNLVEEGEVIYNDYVFSNRLKVPKAVRNKYKLGGLKSLTFADAAKRVAKESEERPFDPISKNGLEAGINDLIQVQEAVRQQKEQAEMIAQEGNTYAIGSWLKRKKKSGLKYDIDWYKQKALSLGMPVEDINFKDFTLGKTDKQNLEFFNKVYKNFLEKRAEEDYNKAQRRSAFNKDVERGKYKQSYKDDNTYYKANAWDTSGSGWINSDWRYDPEAPTKGILSDEEYSALDDDAKKAYKRYNYNAGDRVLDYYDKVSYGKDPLLADAIMEGYTPSGFKYDESSFIPVEFDNESSSNPLTSLRYAPVVAGAYGVFSDLMGWSNKPDYTAANTILQAGRNATTPDVTAPLIGDYLTYRPLDRDYLVNKINAQSGATRRALLNTAGMNRGTAGAGILANDYNTINSIGDAYMKMEMQNRGLEENAITFNRDTNKFNVDNIFKGALANQSKDASQRDLLFKSNVAAAELRQKIDAQASAGRAANFTNFFNSLGNIGREEVMKSWINENPALYYAISTSGKGTPYNMNIGAEGGYLTIKNNKRRRK